MVINVLTNLQEIVLYDSCRSSVSKFPAPYGLVLRKTLKWHIFFILADRQEK